MLQRVCARAGRRSLEKSKINLGTDRSPEYRTFKFSRDGEIQQISASKKDPSYKQKPYLELTYSNGIVQSLTDSRKDKTLTLSGSEIDKTTLSKTTEILKDIDYYKSLCTDPTKLKQLLFAIKNGETPSHNATEIVPNESIQ